MSGERLAKAAVPCRNCGHHPGDHKGYQGQPEARCLDFVCSCRGYRDLGPGIREPRWMIVDGNR